MSNKIDFDNSAFDNLDQVKKSHYWNYVDINNQQ